MPWKKAVADCTATGIKREYKLVTGDWNSASLLSQIIYWRSDGSDGTPRAKVWRQNRFWVADPIKKWTDSCMITDAEYRRSAKLLVDRGLVVTAVFKFRGINCVHFSIEDESLANALAAAISGNPPKVVNSHFTKCDINSSQNANTAVSYTTDSALDSALDSKTAIDIAETSVDAQETLKAHKEKQTQVLPGASLAFLWKKRYTTIYGGFIKGFTQKEMGQFKKLREALGENGAPVIEYVLANWGKFAYKVAGDKGIHNTPEKPVVGFVLAHYDVALQLIAEPNVPHPTYKPKQVVYTVAPATESPVKGLEEPAFSTEQIKLVEHFKAKADAAKEL
jgi:hypothetical protein